MISRRTRLAAAVLAAAALGSWPAPAGARSEPTAVRIERDLAAVEQELAAAERALVVSEETGAARAERRAEDGARQYALGDWLHAAVTLSDAVDEPEWAAAEGRARAVFLLADALRRQGLCGAARARYQELLARPDAPDRAEALSGALDCAVKERRQVDVEPLLAEAARVFGDATPPEVRYLAAKAAYQRTDLPRGERVERALEAFAQVHGAFQLQAWYFQGVLEIEDENPRASLEYFESCARVVAETPRDRELRELCLLAAGRVHAELGDVAAAVEWYGHVPPESPRYGEAVYEVALAHVKGKQWASALAVASIVPDLVPDAPQAPEASLLRGHLLLRLGRHAEAAQVYGRVVDAYAPVRDEVDAILAARADPVRWFDELIARQGGAFDVASVLPPVAVRWATARPEVAAAVDLVRSVAAGRGDVQAARDVADRLDALLRRGGGLDAFPGLLATYAHAQAVENAAARAEGGWVAAAAAAAERDAPPWRRTELARAREARAALDARFVQAPRSAWAVEARRARLRARVDEADEATFRASLAVAGTRGAIAGIEAWLDRRRGEAAVEIEAQELSEELRKHRAVIDGYEAELASLRQEVAKVRDAAGGFDALREEGELRDEYLAAVDREREAVEAAARTIAPADRELLGALPGALARLADVRGRAREVEVRVAAEAARRAELVQARVDAERGELLTLAAALDDVVQGDARDVLGRIALRSVADVRAALYRLVLKADLGLVDVAWSRKRQRLESVQALAAQKDAELQRLERDHRALLREVE